MDHSAFRRIFRFCLGLLTLFTATLSICAFISSNFGGVFQIFGFYALFQPLFIVLNFILLLYWAIRLKFLLFLPLLALILNIGYISSVYQIPLKLHKTATFGGNHIHLATYNVKGFYHGQRSLTVSMITDFMKEKEVDLLCLQEVDLDTTYTLDSLEKAFSFLPYTSIAVSERAGFSLMVLSKYPIIKSSRIRFGGEGNQAMWTDLLISGDTVRLFNYHLQTTNFNQARFPIVPQNWLWDLSGEAEKSMTVYDVLMNNFKKRTQQAAYIHRRIDATNYPTLVCGDMNSNPSSYTYHQIKGHLHDGFKTCGSGYEYTLKGLRKLFRIDYIFHSKDFEGHDYKSYLLDYSDHKPVIMDISLSEDTDYKFD